VFTVHYLKFFAVPHVQGLVRSRSLLLDIKLSELQGRSEFEIPVACMLPVL
jgi:hypothetical protein